MSMWLAAGAALLRGLPLLLRGEATLKVGRSKPLSLLKEFLVRGFVRMTSGVAYSCAANRRYYEYFGATADKLISVPCAVDNTFFGASARAVNRADARAELGVSIGARVILYVGRLTEIKRPWDLLALYDELAGIWPDLCLLLVGDGPLRAEMERDCDAANRKGVRFEGFRNQGELARYYQTADVFVLTSREDPSPKALNEAMAFGLPVVVTESVGTAEDLVSNGENGYIVPVGEPKVMAKACREVLETELRRSRMGADSLRRIGEWTFERGAAAIAGWVEEVAS